jgi:hypothetical protein
MGNDDPILGRLVPDGHEPNGFQRDVEDAGVDPKRGGEIEIEEWRMSTSDTRTSPAWLGMTSTGDGGRGFWAITTFLCSGMRKGTAGYRAQNRAALSAVRSRPRPAGAMMP